MRKKIFLAITLSVFIILIAAGIIWKQMNDKGSSIISIGAVLPLTGTAAQYGQYCRQGVELAIADANRRYAPDGLQFQVIIEDSKAEPKEAVTVAKKLISVDHVPAMVCLTTGVTSAIAPICERSQVVLITSTIAPKAADLGDYVFRNATNLVNDAEAMAEHAVAEMNLKRVAIIGLNVDGIRAMEAPFRARVKSLGGRVVAVEFGNRGETDFRTQLTKIKAANPDALYILGYIEIAYMLRQARELGIDAVFLGDPSMESPKILEIAGEAANGTIYTKAAFDVNESSPVIKSFSDSYEKAYNQKPEIFAAQMYDSILMLCFVIAREGKTGEKIRSRLIGLKNFPGVSGETTFLPNGDVKKPILFKTIKDSEFHRWSKES